MYSVQSNSFGSTISALDVVHGEILRQIDIPAKFQTTGLQGLAATNNRIYYLDGSNSIAPELREFDVRSGEVANSWTLEPPQGSELSGLAYLNGQLYLLDGANQQLWIWSLETNSIESLISIDVELAGGLAGAGGRKSLFESNRSGQIFEIDPVNGRVLNVYQTSIGPIDGGLAYLNGELIASPLSNARKAYRIDPNTVQIKGELDLPGNGTISGLGEFETGIELWKSDGTEAGTALVKDITPGPNSSDLDSYFFEVVNNDLFFTIFGANGQELWKTDGTEQGTVSILNEIEDSIYQVDNLTEFRNLLFFSAFTEFEPEKLWRTDGTKDGTYSIDEIAGRPRQFAAVSDCFLAIATDDAIWSSRGLEGSSRRITPDHASSVEVLAALDRQLYFSAFTEDAGHELWISDGSSDGTMLLADLLPGPEGTRLVRPFATDRYLFFTAELNEQTVLFRTDGTQSGTIPLTEGRFPRNRPDIQSMATIGDELVFATHSEGPRSYDLWRSDGTVEGTSIFENFDAGSRIQLQSNGSEEFFSAWNDASGMDCGKRTELNQAQS